MARAPGHLRDLLARRVAGRRPRRHAPACSSRCSSPWSRPARSAGRRPGSPPSHAPSCSCSCPSTARAQTFALPLFALLVWMLARDARAPDRRVLWVIPLLVLWANLHGSVLLASVLVLLRCAIGAGVAMRARRARDLLHAARARGRGARRAVRIALRAEAHLLLLGHRDERRVPQHGDRVGGHDDPRVAHLLPVRGDRDHRDPPARAAARPVREARARGAAARRARHRPEHRVAADRSHDPPAPRPHAVVAAVAGALAPTADADARSRSPAPSPWECSRRA